MERDYKKLYEEAFKRAKEDYDNVDTSNYERRKLENIFPELKESEDDRIKRCIGDVVRKYGREFTTGTVTKEKMLAWLEKQGEQKPIDKIDKVEPKFNVGDWIINNDKRIAIPTQILEIEEYGYVTSRGYTSFDKVKTDYHLWTIEDAKEVNLEKHLKEDIEDVFFDLAGVAVKGATSYLTVEDVKDIARHFFELGLKAQKGE